MGKPSRKKNLLKKKKTNSRCASSSLPPCWPHFSIFPHDGIFFSHLYLTNACTYTQDIYLEILIKPFFFLLCLHSQKKYNMLASQWHNVRRRRMKRKFKKGIRQKKIYLFTLKINNN